MRKLTCIVVLCLSMNILSEKISVPKSCSNSISTTCDINSDCPAWGECIMDCNKNGIDDIIDIENGSLIDNDSDGISDECESRYESCVQPYQYMKTHTPEWPYKTGEIPTLCNTYWYKILGHKETTSGWYTLAYHWISANINMKLESLKPKANFTGAESFYGDAYECYLIGRDLLESFCFEKFDLLDSNYPDERNEAFGCGLVLAEFNEGLHDQKTCAHHKTKYNSEDEYSKAESIYFSMKMAEIPGRGESYYFKKNASVFSKLSTGEIVLTITLIAVITLGVILLVVKIAVPKWKLRRTYRQVELENVEFE